MIVLINPLTFSESEALWGQRMSLVLVSISHLFFRTLSITPTVKLEQRYLAAEI